MTEEELNSLESKCMDGNPLYCEDCPFASVELCKNQCLETEEKWNSYISLMMKTS